ncbi:MAG: hypothetical protein JW778_04475 [Candidatus Altiarchaeota archaeon]|nr:hypothetical protein [Candidatus Altiarchaeota archaeon]
MKLVKDLISRIRWNVVISMIAVVIFIFMAISFFNPFTPDYRCSNGLCINAYTEPGEVELTGESTLWVDLRNRGTDDLNIYVKLKTRNPALLFRDEREQETEKAAELGAGESMKLNFDLKANATYPGTYRVDVTVTYSGGHVEDDVYLNVK